MTQFSAAKAVLFDLDDTLLERGRSYKAILRDVFDLFAADLAPVTWERFWEAYVPRAFDLWYMMVDGVLSGDVAQRYSFVNALRFLGADEGLTTGIVEERDKRIIEESYLVEDALTVLDELRGAGKRLGLVTNGYTEMQRRKIEHHGLEQRVDFVVISQEVGSFKPDKAIYTLALSKAGASAAEAVFIGDSLNTDIAGARGVGLPCVLYDPHQKHQDGVEPKPDHTIRHLTELLSLLGGRGEPRADTESAASAGTNS